jgi:transcriptional regulator with XRE-family HTH domain
LSQAAVAKHLGCSQDLISLFELGKLSPGIVWICELAAVLGLEPSLTFHRVGPPLRDKGHEALIARLVLMLSPAWHVRREIQFPNPGDPRWWDLLLRLATTYRLGVEAETRIRDFQELVRRIHGRAQDGGADHVLLILSDSAHNRSLVGQLRTALGEEFATSTAAILAALRNGDPLLASGVILL